jgi:hypothetical protein
MTTSGTTTFPAAGANLTMIDPSAGQQCGVPGRASNQASISWNATGPQGPPGPTGANGSGGAPGKSVTIAGGHTLTLGGGQVVTVGGDAGGVTINSPTVNPRGRALGLTSFGGKADLSFDDLLSISFAAVGGSGGAARTQIHDITITKKVDKASPLLLKACANGKHFPTVKITLRKAGGTKFLVYELKTVIISSYQESGAGGRDNTPVDHLTLQYSSVSMKHS